MEAPRSRARALADLDQATDADWLRAFGFADVMGNEVDCAETRIIVSACSFDGRYGGRTESKHLHTITFASTGFVTDFNGMSGGPVFYTRQASDAWTFAGILVTQGPGLLRLIDARAIRATFEAHYARA